ncbi:MAG TPA: site-2 protease family protein, partial [Oculatellaceae cyanobacterium]
MFMRSIPLFNLFGFQVRLDPSWLFLAFLLVWALSQGMFPYFYPGLSSAVYFWMGIISVIGLFGCIVLHEFGHAWVAQRFGLPMRGITLFLFGGVAEMGDESPSPKAELWMALAGPAVSVLLLLIFLGLSTIGDAH